MHSAGYLKMKHTAGAEGAPRDARLLHAQHVCLLFPRNRQALQARALREGRWMVQQCCLLLQRGRVRRERRLALPQAHQLHTAHSCIVSDVQGNSSRPNMQDF